MQTHDTLLKMLIHTSTLHAENVKTDWKSVITPICIDSPIRVDRPQILP